MEYKLNLGSWGSVFAVPSDLVDLHLKLAGGVQLKVILWLLRHAGEGFTVDDVAKSLSMQAADVRDSMLYWEENGIIKISDGIIEPTDRDEKTVENSPTSMQDDRAAEKGKETNNSEPHKTDAEQPVKSSRIISRPEKPDMKYLSKRMSESPEIVYLMQSADEIFGRPTNSNDKATLLMIHESDGLPVEVIIMLMQYAADIQKCNIRYIEKMAISWADNEITTLEQAEKRIQQLTSGRNAAAAVQKILGLEQHSPTEKETEYADRWMNIWKFSGDMIRKAYEICVDSKNKYIPKYVDSILNRWFSSGISTPEQADAEKNKGNKSREKKPYGATYDISEYESTSIIDEEGL